MTSLGTKIVAAAITGAFAIFFANPMVSMASVTLDLNFDYTKLNII